MTTFGEIAKSVTNVPSTSPQKNQEKKSLDSIVGKLKSNSRYDIRALGYELEQIAPTLNKENNTKVSRLVQEIADSNLSDPKIYNFLQTRIRELEQEAEKYKKKRKQTEENTRAERTNVSDEVEKLKELELKGLIKGAKNIEEMVNKLKKAIESGHFTEKENKILKKAIQNLENYEKIVLPKIDDDLNKALNQIKNSTFPTDINILGYNVNFQNKEQALKAIKLIKEKLGASDSNMLYNYASALVYLLTAPLQPGYQLSKPLAEWGILDQGQDILDHIEGREWGKLFFGDLGTALLMLFLIGNINSIIGFALRESVGRNFKNMAGRMGMQFVQMEDYSKKIINPQDIEGPKAQEYQEFIQREAILKGLKTYIETLEDGDLKSKLEKDLKILEKYKLIKGPEFFFKANLIANQVGLKNFKDPLFYRNLGLSLLNGARFILVSPNIKEHWSQAKGLQTLKLWKYFKWGTISDPVSFSKQILTPEINNEIEYNLDEQKEDINKYFNGIELDFTDNNEYKIEIGEVNKEFLEKLKAYIYNDTNLPLKEKEQIFNKVKLYLENISKNNIFISEEKLGQDLTKIIDKKYLSYDEIKELIKNNNEFKEFLEDRRIKDFFYENKKINTAFLFREKKKFVELVKMFKNGKLEGDKKTIEAILQDFIDGKEIKPNYKSVDNNLNNILDKGEEIIKSIEEAKKILNGEVYENLKTIIDLDQNKFPDDLERKFKNILPKLEKLVEDGELTTEELKKELVKIYNGYLPKVEILDSIRTLSGENVDKFRKLVETGKWVGTFKDLEKVIEDLENGKEIKEKIVTFNDLDAEIAKINKKGKELAEKNFRNQEFGIFDKGSEKEKINEDKFKDIKVYSILLNYNKEDININKNLSKLFAKINNGNNYTIEDFSEELKKALNINIDFETTLEDFGSSLKTELENFYNKLAQEEKIKLIGRAKNIKNINDIFFPENIKNALGVNDSNIRKVLDSYKEDLEDLIDIEGLQKMRDSLNEELKNNISEDLIKEINELKREINNKIQELEGNKPKNSPETEKSLDEKIKALQDLLRSLEQGKHNKSFIEKINKSLEKLGFEYTILSENNKDRSIKLIKEKLQDLKLEQLEKINPELFKAYLEEKNFEEILKEYGLKINDLKQDTKQILKQQINNIKEGQTEEIKEKAKKEFIEKLKELKKLSNK